jgi:hypothetical protein
MNDTLNEMKARLEKKTLNLEHFKCWAATRKKRIERFKEDVMRAERKDIPRLEAMLRADLLLLEQELEYKVKAEELREWTKLVDAAIQRFK